MDVDSWTHLSEAQTADSETVWDTFLAYFEPKTNYRLAQFQLREMAQTPGESIDMFVTRLKTHAQRCQFDEMVHSRLKDNLIDQIIKGTYHDAVCKKLLDANPKALTLDQAVSLARTHEATQAQMQQLNQVHGKTINTVRTKVSKPRSSRPQSKTCFFCGGKAHKWSRMPCT